MTSVSHEHSSNKGITMSNLLFNRKSATVAVAAVAVLGGGAAFAYPSGQDLTVSAIAKPNGSAIDVTVTVDNANPTCGTSIQVQGGADTVFPAGQTTGVVVIPAGSAGSRRVEARTVGCAKGSKEHAHSKFTVLDAKATGAATSPKGQNYRVEFTGLDASSSVTSTATLNGGTDQLVNSDNVDKRGEATVKFKLKKSGTWVITTVISPSGTVNSVTDVVP
jgi:hypothetical protein